MHLFTEYALSTGSKLDKPFILEKFYPLPFDKYITIHASSNMPAKNYDYYLEVCHLLKPFFDNLGIQIIQLGGKDDIELTNVKRLCGETNLGQSAYIIKRALLHLGNDSSLVHIADAMNTPIVGLYSVSPPLVCGPYFNYNYTCLEPSFPKGIKYSYNPNEPEKYVNTIKPEIVAQSVLDLLKIEAKIPLKTLYIGAAFKQSIIEVVPNNLISPDQFTNQLITIRADWLFNEDYIYNQLSVRKCNIVTDKPLNIDILKQLKNNIDQIIIRLEDIDLFDFVKKLHNTSIKYSLITYKKGNELNELKFKYLDFEQVSSLAMATKKSIISEINSETLFATNKATISEGKMYPSQAHWKANIPNQPENKIIDNDIFYQDLNYMFIYKKN